MFSRDRLCQLAVRGWLIGLILISSPALSQTYEGVESGSAKHSESNQPASPTAEESDALFWKYAKGKPEAYRAICEKPTNRTDADLCQQWRMAEAAKKQAHWTKRQFFATIVEIIALVAAVSVAAWAAVAASRAAIAAGDVVKVTSDTAERQLRAYVAQEEIIWMTLEQGNPKTISGYSVTIRWKNCGATPARRCRTHTTAGSFENGLPKDFEYRILSDMIPLSEKSHMGPNGTANSTVILPVATVQAAQRGEIRIFVWGWIEYDDIFEKTPRRRTEICVQVSVSPDGSQLTFTLAGPFNGADEDCHHQPETQANRT